MGCWEGGGHGTSPGALLSEREGAASTVGSPGPGGDGGPGAGSCRGFKSEQGGEPEEVGWRSTAVEAPVAGWITPSSPILSISPSGDEEEERGVVEEVVQEEECGEVSEEEEAGGGWKEEGGSEWESSAPVETEVVAVAEAGACVAAGAEPAEVAPVALYS